MCRPATTSPPRATPRARLGAADVAGHDARLEKHAGADHIGNVDRDGAPGTDSASQAAWRRCHHGGVGHRYSSIGQMNAEFSQIGAFLLAALLIFVVYRRFRRSFGQQPLLPLRMQMRILLLLIVGCLLLPAAMRSTSFLLAILGGVAAGVALALLGRRTHPHRERCRSPVLCAAHLHGNSRLVAVHRTTGLPAGSGLWQSGSSLHRNIPAAQSSDDWIVLCVDGLLRVLLQRSAVESPSTPAHWESAAAESRPENPTRT